MAAKSQERMEALLPDALGLITFALQPSAPANLRTEALACFTTWAFYAQRVWSEEPQYLEGLRSLLTSILELSTGRDIDADIAVGHMADLLANFGLFFKPEHLAAASNVLRSDWGKAHMASFMDNDPSAESFVRLLLAFGDVAVRDLILKSHDSACQEIMTMMHQLLKYDGYAVADDTLISEAVQFWATYVEDAVEKRDEAVTSESEWLPTAKQHVSQMVEELWFKL
ncbi:hypothetical protein LTS18_000944, partial [Coniosporium uncinatum]